uniref:Uncharacterized protein n=1 Tax=Knipowitschia caucasica TaxID=637954 RepID=A0AAV2JLR9_KNICA
MPVCAMRHSAAWGGSDHRYALVHARGGLGRGRGGGARGARGREPIRTGGGGIIMRPWGPRVWGAALGGGEGSGDSEGGSGGFGRGGPGGRECGWGGAAPGGGGLCGVRIAERRWGGGVRGGPRIDRDGRNPRGEGGPGERVGLGQQKRGRVDGEEVPLAEKGGGGGEGRALRAGHPGVRGGGGVRVGGARGLREPGGGWFRWMRAGGSRRQWRGGARAVRDMVRGVWPTATGLLHPERGEGGGDGGTGVCRAQPARGTDVSAGPLSQAHRASHSRRDAPTGSALLIRGVARMTVHTCTCAPPLTLGSAS